MRFDLIPNFSPGETIPWIRSLEMMREQTGLAEQAGFTTAWFTEHHFAHNGYMNAPPNPIQMCTHMAARFDKIRVGTCPVVLPDWHPLRVAEDVAMLDNMSMGRVDFGIAKGINERATGPTKRSLTRVSFISFRYRAGKKPTGFLNHWIPAITMKTVSTKRCTCIHDRFRIRIRRCG